jgi:DedD protein
MALPPLLKPRAPDVADTSPMDVADVQARSRARRRLIGAAVLLLLGVVSFPLLFESQPRPVPVDTPMVIPSREGATPLQAPGKGQERTASGTVVMAEPAAPSASAPAVAAPLAASAALAVAAPSSPVAAPPAVVSAAPRAQVSTPAPVPVVVAAAPSAPAPSPQAAAKTEPKAKPEAKPEPKAETKAAPKAEAKPEARAEPKADTKSSTRFVVQVGAYADESAAKDVRQRVEKLGFKTFTQDIQTPNGRRIRVRIGPFASQADAQKALERLKGASLPGAVLTL